MRIEKLLSIDNYVLAIYYTDAHGYQTAILTATGRVHQLKLIFYLPSTAEAEGRRLIEVLSLMLLGEL